jgi:hypothetical protein
MKTTARSALLWCFALGFLSAPPGLPTAEAGELATIIRRAGRVADDIPINKIDDVAAELTSSGATRRALRKAGAAADDAVERARTVRRLLKEAMGDVEPALLKQIDELDQPAREVGLILARGSHGVREKIPDIAIRSRFIRGGGAETLAALGLYDDLVDDAILFDGALRAGRILPAPGGSGLTLENFGRFFRSSADRAHRFWTTCVRPHWKLWLGSSALAAVMLAPDEYLDAAGDLTQQGIEKIGRLGGAVLAGAVRGTIHTAGDAGKGVIRDTVVASWTTFFQDVWGVLTVFVLILAAALLAPPVRRRLRSLVSGHPVSQKGSTNPDS